MTAILPLVQRLADGARVDVLDARARERAVGQDAHLVAEQRHRLAALGLDRERDQADAHLLAGRRDDVQLALVGDARVICLASLSRRLVSPDIAETMTTTWCPCRCVARQRRATARIRSTVPTDVPPYF